MLRLTRAQVREIDRRAIEDYHIPGIVLMENAARSAAAVAMGMSKDHKSAVIVAGGGNNGGDGLAVARHLHNAGWHVEVVGTFGYTGDALINLQIVEAMGIRVAPIEDSEDYLRPYAKALVVDALFGTGLKSKPRAREQVIISIINDSGLPILAIDVPSGLDCDTGQPLGEPFDEHCVRATKTVTFVAEKAGFANPDSKKYTGEVIVGDIGCPRELIEEVTRSAS